MHVCMGTLARLRPAGTFFTPRRIPRWLPIRKGRNGSVNLPLDGVMAGMVCPPLHEGQAILFWEQPVNE